MDQTHARRLAAHGAKDQAASASELASERQRGSCSNWPTLRR
jgi:hypothetical protein